MFKYILEVPTIYAEDGTVAIPEQHTTHERELPPRLGTVIYVDGTQYWTEKVHYFKSKPAEDSGPVGVITLMDEEAWLAVQEEISSKRLRQQRIDSFIFIAIALVVLAFFNFWH
jgi:hypothetical protein